jgi:hypothetical protein
LNQNAPSVDYPVGRFLLGKRKLALLAVLAASAIVWFVFFEGLTGWRAGLWLGCCVLVFLSSLLTWRQAQEKCWLSWNGDAWRVLDTTPNVAMVGAGRQLSGTTLESQFQEGAALTVHLDWQNYLYVSLTTPSQSKAWFWLEKASFPERWHGFRCAVYSRS